MFGTVDLDKCKVVTRLTSEYSAGSLNWLTEHAGLMLYWKGVAATKKKSFTAVVGVGTKKGVANEFSVEYCVQGGPEYEMKVYAVNSTPTVEKPELHDIINERG